MSRWRARRKLEERRTSVGGITQDRRVSRRGSLKFSPPSACSSLSETSTGSRCWQVMTCIRTFARRVQTTKTRRGGGACGWRGGRLGRGECLVTGTTDVTAIHRRTEPCYLALVDKSMHPQYPSTGRSHLTAGLLPSLVPRTRLRDRSPHAVSPRSTLSSAFLRSKFLRWKSFFSRGSF